MGETDYKDPEWADEDFAEMDRITDEGSRKHSGRSVQLFCDKNSSNSTIN